MYHSVTQWKHQGTLVLLEGKLAQVKSQRSRIVLTMSNC